MNKQSIVNKIEKLETASTCPRWKVVIVDASLNPVTYSGDCGDHIDKATYEKWLQTLSFDDQLIVVSIEVNQPIKATVDNYAAHSLVTLQNNASQNVPDLLAEYAALKEENQQ